MSRRSRSLALMVAMIPLLAVVVSATGIPVVARVLLGAVFATVALVAVARAAATDRG
jgi:hypothetical protein